MCGGFLRRLLAEESRHSTPVGRLLLSVLLVFRVALLAAGGPGVYGDEQSEFQCNTQQPGCKAACFDAMRPLSPLRFWAFQVILVAVPGALYLAFTLYHVVWHWEDPGKAKEEEDTLILEGERSKDAVRTCKQLWAYVAQLGARLVLEGATLGVQYHLYGVHMPLVFECHAIPCPYSVTCSPSCPSEKSIFLKTMFGVSWLCFSFMFLELVLLGLRRRYRGLGNLLGVSFPSSHILPQQHQKLPSATLAPLPDQPCASLETTCPVPVNRGTLHDPTPPAVDRVRWVDPFTQWAKPILYLELRVWAQQCCRLCQVHEQGREASRVSWMCACTMSGVGLRLVCPEGEERIGES